MDKQGPVFEIRRGVKQGDPLFPILFNCLLEDVFQKLNRESKGIKINGTWFNNLRFADDVVLISQDAEELQEMASEFEEEGLKVGLHINVQKTVLISNQKVKPEIKLGSKKVTVTESTIYLEQSVSFENNLEKEIRRRAQTWKNFWSLRGIYKNKMSMKVKKKICESCTLPVFTYGSQTWVTTEAQILKLSRTQLATKWSLAGIKWRDKIRNTYIRELTGVKDCRYIIKKLKFDYAGHVARGEEGRWERKV